MDTMICAERVTKIIWLIWFISCLTRNNWIILLVSIMGITVNTFLFRKKRKQLLEYAISSGILLFAVIGNTRKILIAL